MPRFRPIRLLVVALVGCLCFGATLYAQEKATVVGTVTDSTGAVMPGVKVTVTNTGTTVTRTVETNSAGNYIAPELPIGQYSVRAEFKGFKAYERTGIVLNVNDVLRVDIQPKFLEALALSLNEVYYRAHCVCD